MAVTHPSGTVLWSAASSKTVTSATQVFSDAYSLDATCVGVNLTVKADNQGTPASGDTAVFVVAWSIDGSNYDTGEHAQYLTTLDTYSTNTPGEDPAQRTFALPRGGAYLKVGVTCANAATRNVLITATVEEERIA